MKIVAVMLAAGLFSNIFGESTTSGTNGPPSNTNGLYKIERVHRLYGVHLKTNELPKIEEDYRRSGSSDGIFNVPEWVSEDEWDGQTYAIARRNEKGELVPLSKGEVTRNRVSARPYVREGGFRNYTTLGQLAKQCDGVFIGRITGVRFESPEGLARMSRGVGVNVGLSFHVETNLFGDLPAVTVTLPMLWYEGEGRPPAVGMRVMAFYARGYAIEIWDHAPDGFGWEKPPEDPGAPPAVLMDNGSSIRILDAPELEKAYIATVGEYLRLLRREKRDPGKYYEFLRPLAKSPVWRIRQDAREDLLKLLGPNGPGNFDLERLLDDPELMDIFKDYIRYVAIPARERRRAEAQKQQ